MQREETDVIIIGAGPAGLQAGKALAVLGRQVLILEKEDRPGGKLLKWDSLFPFGDDPAVVLGGLLRDNGAFIRTSAELVSYTYSDGLHHLSIRGGRSFSAAALVLATGFRPFDARLKEEYGYGIYPNVITSVDLERMFSKGSVTTGRGGIPEKVAVVHCVGSRDVKAGIEYCSSVCCITGIKQSMKLCRLYPKTRVHHLYMDLRLGGRFHEFCYKEAQMKYRVRFIRGRLSEANPGPGETLEIRYEDTLAGRPARMTVDLLVLLVGMVPEPLECLDRVLQKAADGFYGDGALTLPGKAAGKEGSSTPGYSWQGMAEENGCRDGDRRNGSGGLPGSPARSSVFFAGACAGPKNLVQSLEEANSVALEVHQYLRNIPDYEHIYPANGIRFQST
jgi:heterodisulfide reductase subunit A